MKITLKTLRLQTFLVDVDVEKDTVLNLKEKLCDISGKEYQVDRHRLIYLGKIMEDEHLLSEYKLDHKKFVVVMSKPPPARESDEGGSNQASDVKTDASSAAQATDTKETPDPKETDVKSSPSASNTSTQSASDDQQKAPEDGKSADNNPVPSTNPTEAEIQKNVQMLVEMGYSERSAMMALEICANIPDRAVEYLLSEMGSGESSVPMSAVPSGVAVPGGDGADANPLAFMRNNPVFQDMKRILREDPTLLPFLMRRIRASNPELLEIISENQEEFLALINEGQGQGQGQGRVLSQDVEDIAAAMVNSLTPSDMDAIERLKALGYPEHLVIQAYIACERDEYNAAEFLLTQTLDDDD